MMIEVLIDGKWKEAVQEVDIGFGWVRFHFPKGPVMLAAPEHWRAKLNAEDSLPQ